jgi:hypothetical protein
MKRLEVLAGATYDGIDDRELPMSVDGVPRVLEVDHLVLCTCQEPLWELLGPLKAAGAALQLLGVPSVAPPSWMPSALSARLRGWLRKSEEWCRERNPHSGSPAIPGAGQIGPMLHLLCDVSLLPLAIGVNPISALCRTVGQPSDLNRPDGVGDTVLTMRIFLARSLNPDRVCLSPALWQMSRSAVRKYAMLLMTEGLSRSVRRGSFTPRRDTSSGFGSDPAIFP